MKAQDMHNIYMSLNLIIGCLTKNANNAYKVSITQMVTLYSKWKRAEIQTKVCCNGDRPSAEND